MTRDPDERFLYLLELDLSHPVIAAFMRLADDSETLQDARSVWRAHASFLLLDDFAEIVEEITGNTPTTCGECAQWVWDDETRWVPSLDAGVCESCLSDFYYCDNCEEYCRSATTVGNNYYCDSCLEDCFYWCDYCGEWVDHEHDHEPEDCDCDCNAPHRSFRFPNNGNGTVRQDERFEVTLPAGTIDPAGQCRIVDLLTGEGIDWCAARQAVENVGDQWQTKRGNYTRRLSRELYTSRKIKVGDHTLSEIGNIARQHSTDTSEWSVTFTRDLNLSAADFVHRESCYWGSYAASRCALKSWGGLGLRAFDHFGDPVGRVWVQPVNADLEPTHDTEHAHGYVVFNAYGSLGQYEAARIVAHLTSLTYKKVTLESSIQYINAGGVLVADETTCQQTSSVNWSYDQHDQRDARDVERSAP